jgi:phosphatidylglycerophosphate synthase
MLDAPLRPVKDRLLEPLVRALGGRVHPNLVTLLAFAAGLACALLALRGLHLPALAAWWLNRLLDGLDGLVARRHGMQTDLGGYLDLLLDFVVYAAVPLGLVAGRHPAEPAAWLALSLLLASFYVNAASWMYLSALAARPAAPTTGIPMPGGIVEGAETLAFYSLFLLFPAAAVPLFGVMALLVALTVAQRLLWAVRHLGRAPRGARPRDRQRASRCEER